MNRKYGRSAISDDHGIGINERKDGRQQIHICLYNDIPITKEKEEQQEEQEEEEEEEEGGEGVAIAPIVGTRRRSRRSERLSQEQ